MASGNLVVSQGPSSGYVTVLGLHAWLRAFVRSVTLWNR